MTSAVPVSPAIAKAAEAAWSRYASTVRMGGTELERRWTYARARAAELALWRAEGAPAAKAGT